MQTYNLIDELIRGGYLRTSEIIAAFKKIKRIDFVLDADRDKADINSPLPIGYNQTISQPLTVAFMLELLQPQSGEKILDVGCGSGWTTALLCEIVGKQGKVYGIDIIDELVRFTASNVGKYDFIKDEIAVIQAGDGYRGLSEFAPFDKILVSAAAEEIPEELVKQLKDGGKMVLPIGAAMNSQDIVVVNKINQEKIDIKKYYGFLFVPLVKNNI